MSLTEPAETGRRSSVAAAATTSAVSSASTGPLPSRRVSDSVIIRTTAGRIAGERDGGLSVFRGVPYAAPPVGRLRFCSPRPPEPWTGVRDATRFGSPSLQSDYLRDSHEDSLYANVWSPDVRGRRPVLVYIHGGGWLIGAGSEPDYDGARLASRGDLVVVNFNYRLGVLGWGLHEAFTDQKTDSFSNWGLQDQVALLHWIRENAEAFGGDPGNITLAGTSAGGSSTWQLSLLPELRGTIARTIPISVQHVREPASSATPDDSRAVYGHLARQLGTTVPGLRDVPAEVLKGAWEDVFSGSPTKRLVDGWREYQGPVVDGRWMHGYDHALPSPRIPMMPIFTRTEGSFFTTGPGYPFQGPHPTNEAELREAIQAVLHKGAVEVTDTEVDACIAFYRRAAEADGQVHDPVSLWTEVWGDGLFRHQIIRLAERHAAEGGSPQYLMEFAHPVKPPYSGTPHEASSKFLFGSYALPVNAPVYGDGPLERQVSDALIDLVASFARGEAPNSGHTPVWPVFSEGGANTMILGGEGVAEISEPSTLRQLRYWDAADWAPKP